METRTYREMLAAARLEATLRYLQALLEQHQGNVTAAAQQAGIERESFHRLLRLHGIQAEPFRHPATPVDPESR